MIGNKPQGMKLIGYLHPPKVKDNTLSPVVCFDMTEIQDACQQCLQNSFQNSFQTCHLLFMAHSMRFIHAFVSGTLDFCNVEYKYYSSVQLTQKTSTRNKK